MKSAEERARETVGFLAHGGIDVVALAASFREYGREIAARQRLACARSVSTHQRVSRLPHDHVMETPLVDTP